MNTKQLRQKILDLAIRGKLVPQDSNDEPASKLLERIRAEKEQLIKNKKMKRDKNESYIFVGDDKLHYEKFADGSVVCIEDEIPFGIPENWAWARGKEIFKGLSSTKPSNDFFKYIDIDAIDNKTHKVKTPKIIETKNAPSRASRYVENGDILFSMVRPYLENIALITKELQDCIASTGFYVCSPFSLLNSNFIYNLMLSQYVIKGLNFFMKGDNSPSINASDIEDFLYPISPQSEQARISSTVQKLLEIIEAIENDKTDLSDLIKQTKDKVLDLAIKGKLGPQDPNDEPADKLLEKIREEKEKLIKEGKLKRDKNETYIFKNSDDNSYYEQIDGETVCINDDLPFEIPQSWRWCKVDNVTTIKGGKRLPSGQSLLNDKTNHPYLRIVDMKNNTIIDDDIHYISEDVFAKIKQYIITDEDLYITIAGTIGDVGIIPSKYNNANLTENAVRVTPLLINKKYLMYLILSNYVHNQFIDKTHHVAMPKLAIERIKGVFVPIPPLFEQSNIINKLESIFSYLDNIESIIKGS